MKRVKYNWLFIIKDLGLSEKFESYRFNTNLSRHIRGKKDISINRLGRAFVLHVFKTMGFHLTPNYIVGHERSMDDYLEELRASAN